MKTKQNNKRWSSKVIDIYSKKSNDDLKKYYTFKYYAKAIVVDMGKDNLKGRLRRIILER